MHLKVEADPVSVWFIKGVVGVFTALALLSFFTRMSYAGPDEYLMLVIGLIGVALIWRTHRYYRVANISVLSDAMVWRPFWRPTVRVRYEDVDFFVGAWREINPRIYLPGLPAGFESGETLNINELLIVLKSGQRRKIVLPPTIHIELTRSTHC